MTALPTPASAADVPRPPRRRHRPRPGHRGPGGPLHAHPRRLRRHRGQGGAGPRAGSRAHPAALLRLRRRPRLPPPCVDLKDDDGRDAFLALVARADVVVESFRPGVLDRLGLGFDRLSAVNPRIVLCSTTASGRTGPRRRGPGTTSTTSPWAATWPPASRGPTGDRRSPAPPSPTPPAGGMHAALAVMAALVGRGADGAGAHLDVAVADGVLWLMSLAVDEHLATGRRGRPRPRRRLRPLCLLRLLPRGRRSMAGRGGHRAPRSSPTSAGCSAASTGPATSSTTTSRTRCGPTSGPPSPPSTATSGWRALAGADTCVAPVLTVDEIADDEPVRGPRRLRRGAADPAAERPTPMAPSRRFRQVGPVLAGMPGPRRPGRPPRPARRPTPTSSCRRRALGGADRRPAGEGGGGVTAIGEADIERLVGVPLYEEEGEFPVEQGYVWTIVRVRRERQPAVLGRGGRRAGDRRPHRPAHHGVGLVPSPPLGAEPHDARACRSRSTST